MAPREATLFHVGPDSLRDPQAVESQKRDQGVLSRRA